MLFISACGEDAPSDDSQDKPVQCSDNVDCAEGTYCGADFTCVPDPCTPATCARGECTRGSATCVSKDSCTVATEVEDCVAGDRCIDGACVGEETYCAELDCQRGVCDFGQKACVSAEDCGGEDSNCLEGQFCNSMNQCAPDLCAINEVECTEGGECRPSVGICQNAAECESSADCVAGHVCVMDSETRKATCVLEEATCGDGSGDAGCFGNQLCDYDATTLEAVCVESGSCTTAIDCTGDRQCSGRTCVDPVACAAGPMEPNDTSAEATIFDEVALANGVGASLCSGDVDIFQIDTAALNPGSVRGTLTVRLDYAARDAGLGEVKLQVFDPNGATPDTAVAEDSSGSTGVVGFAEVSIELGAASSKTYLVHISDAGDVLAPGVSYDLSASFLPATTRDVCLNATRIGPQQTLSGDTNNSTSAALGAVCTGVHNNSPENVYVFDVPQASMVTLEVIPEIEETDLAVSVRETCTQMASEKACRNATDEGAETLEVLLDPGTYYAIVQPPEGGMGGAYDIKLTMRLANCSPASSYCDSANVAMICDEIGGNYVARTCATSCNPSTGECVRPMGDRCVNSPIKTADFSATINWAEFSADYQFGDGGCVPSVGGDDTASGDTHTDGREAVWAVKVPANSAVTATLTMAEGEQGSLYIFEDCLYPSNSCLAGANTAGATETLGWANNTAVAKTVFVVADTKMPADGAEKVPLTTATLDVKIEEVICTPEALQCNGDDVEICNPQGTAFVLNQACNFGCTDGACNPPTNQTCSGAIALTSGQTVTQAIDLYTNDYFFEADNATCVGEDIPAEGPEAIYSITTTQPNQVVDVVVNAPYDVVLYATQSCLPSAEPTCFAGTTSVGGTAANLSFAALEAGTYFIYVDSDSSSTTGTFDITATVNTPTCTPGSIIGCSGTGALEYCDATGTPQTYACASGTCTAGACATPGGDVCYDAFALGDGTSITTTLAGANDIEWTPNRTGRCAIDDYDATDGPDNYYRVDLQAGDLLSVELEAVSGSIYAFLIENCAAPTLSCHANTREGPASQTLQYYAETAQSIYVLVDSTSTSSDQQYTISAEITQGSICAPGQARCAGPNALEVCSYDGSVYSAQLTCAAGCFNGACVADAATTDTCVGAPNIGDGIVVHGNFADFANDIEIPSSGCTGSTGDGNDLVYAVDLAAGEVLNARMTSHGNETSMVYIIEDCAAPETTCQAGGYGASDEEYSAYARYVADVPKTVYVVADSTSTAYDESFTLEIGVSAAECSAGATACLDAGTRQYCQQGLWAQETCIYGAGCNFTTGLCEQPGNDTCASARVIPSDGQTHTYVMRPADFAGDYDIDGSSCMEWTFIDSPGPDAVYSVTANLGDIITASLTGPDPVIYMATNCASPMNSCLAGEYEYSGTATFTYKVLAAGTYYLYADVGTSSDSDYDVPMTLDVTVEAPECTLGQTQCAADGTTLQVCDNIGMWAEQTCGFGCSAGACNLPPNDTCQTAEVIPADGAWHVANHPLDLYTNQAELTASCGPVNTYDTDGPDTFYAVDLLAGDVVQAAWDSGSSYDPVWIAGDCANLSGSCVAGAADESPNVASFTAPTAGRYFIIGDTNSSSDDGPFEMRVRAGTPACDPATYAWTCTAGGVQYCETPGFFATHTCSSGGCTAGMCDVRTSDNFFESEDITADATQPAGAVRTGLWGDFGHDFEGDGCGLSSGETDGFDAVYTVQLQAGQTLSATLTLIGAGSTWSNDPSLYLLDSAQNLTSTNCLVGATGSDAAASITHTAAAAGTYYVVAGGDGANTGDTETFELTVNIQ
jgi:hypothetical protein